MNDLRALSPKPELAFLLECARIGVKGDSAARIRPPIANNLDWAYVFALAQEQAVVPLLNLHARHLDGVPSEWRNRLQQVCESITFINLSMAAELFRVLETLRSHGIQAISYKGPALAVQAYGDLALRTFSDLDLIVRHSDVMRACELLMAGGYEPDFALALAASGRIPGQYVFRRKGSRVPIEIHTEKTLRYFPRRLDLDAMSQHLDRISVGGREIFTFSPEEMLPLLCVHGCKHFWDRLLWIADISALATRPRKLDWQQALARARTLGAERMVLLGLCLAEGMLGARIPEDAAARIRADHMARFLANGIRKRYFLEDRSTPAVLERARFRILMRGSLFHAIPYFLRLTTASTEDDWEETGEGAFRPLKGLKGLLRPIRLLRKYGVGIRRN